MSELSDPDPSDDPAGHILRRREDRSALHRALVILAPLGLALDIALSLWVSYMHVSRSAVVQVEPQWRPGERLALRAQLVDSRLGGVESTHANLTLEHADGQTPLPPIEPVSMAGLTQGFVDVPEVPLGDAQLRIELNAPGYEPMTEQIPIEVVEERDARAGEHTVSSSMLQWGDDTDPQPEKLRIDLRPMGRILAGFHNRFMVRVTDLEGEPRVGRVSIVLVHGEFAGERGSEETPPTLYEGPTDSLGLVTLGGMLTSEVVRIEVRVIEEPAADPDPSSKPESNADPKADPNPKELSPRRRFRYVSFPGGVRVVPPRLAVRPGDTLKLEPRSLRRKRPIFVDFHDREGAWVDTLMPPFFGGEEPREWTVPTELPEGFLQLEAYHYTNDPGEGTALARLYVSDLDPTTKASLEPLLKKQREVLALPRLDKSFDVERERGYLDHLAKADLDAKEIKKLRSWLIGSLPIEVFGPPTALSTRLRDEEQLVAKKASWTVGLRWFLWGGGLLFIGVFAVSVWRADREGARELADALREAERESNGGEVGIDADIDAELGSGMLEQLMTARRAMLFRGAIVVGIMIATLVLTVLLMENLVWVA